MQKVENLQQVDLHLHQEMGCGAFGTVRRAIFRGRQAAVKIVELTLHEDLAAPKEAEILSYLAAAGHSSILKLHAAFSCEENLLLVTEFISGCDLDTFLFDEVSNDLYVGELRFFASCIVRAMAFLHSHHLGHFDLKGTHVMVDESRTLKIIDFGMSDIVRSPLSTPRKSTAHYMAPEIMRINRNMGGAPGYGLAADVWSFGVCLYYLYAGELPFANEEGLPFDVYNVVLYDFAGLPTYNEFEEDEFKVLIQSLLRRQPDDRPTFQFLASSSVLC